MGTEDELFSLALKTMLLDKLSSTEYITSIKRIQDDLIIRSKSGEEIVVSIPKGEKGDKGDQGESIQGEAGVDGKDGIDGKNGLDGKDGTDGKDGKDGVNGEKGDKGDAGLPGKDGKDGVNGKVGPKGKDGENGKDGSKGIDGKKGIDGEQGKDGLDGNGITNVYVDKRGNLIIVTRDETYDLGKLKRSGGSGGGSSSTPFTYTNTAPMTMSVGGFPEGTTFDNMSLQDLWTGLLYSNDGLPSFTEFEIDIPLLPPVLEVGQDIPGGDYFALWSIANPMLLSPNSISITYVNESLVLADHIANTEQFEIMLPQISFATPTLISFKIEAKNTLGDSFSKTFDIPVQNRIYVGESSLGILAESDVKALRITQLKDNINGDYQMLAGGYKWFCFPIIMGTRVNFTDANTGFDIPMLDPETVNVTNSYAVTQSYYCYRSFYQLNGAITINIK